MAFVSEEITKEEDKEYFNSLHLLDITKRPLKPYWWAIDRERNYIIYPMGGGSFEIPRGMGLYLNGEVIEMWVKKRTEGEYYSNTYKVFWKVYRIKVPNQLLEQGYNEENILEIIEEAFKGLGVSGVKRSNIAEVTVDIQTEIESV